MDKQDKILNIRIAGDLIDQARKDANRREMTLSEHVKDLLVRYGSGPTLRRVGDLTLAELMTAIRPAQGIVAAGASPVPRPQGGNGTREEPGPAKQDAPQSNPTSPQGT